jgi:hypothetical protein
MKDHRESPRPGEAVSAAFARRAARAEGLAALSSPAAAPLAFASGLFRAQGALATEIARAHVDRPLSGHPEDDLDGRTEDLDALLRFAVKAGPAPLAEAAQTYLTDSRAQACRFWRDGDSGSPRGYLGRALCRPYAEVLAAVGARPEPARSPGGCGFCGRAPWIAWRASVAAGEGAQRFLGCGLCGSAWSPGRILCVACGEERPEQLPIFGSDRYPGARLETCATCRVYVKSIDCTLDGHAIPEVDDLLSIALDLWAREQGYERLEPGLAGL